MSENIDCECEVCKSGPPKCDDCKIELKRGKKSITEEGIELTEFICPKCENKKMDIKIPRARFLEMQNQRIVENN